MVSTFPNSFQRRYQILTYWNDILSAQWRHMGVIVLQIIGNVNVFQQLFRDNRNENTKANPMMIGD